MSSSFSPIPDFAAWIIQKLCKEELIEEILGDLEQYYHESKEQVGWKVKFFFWFQVLNFLRPFALRSFQGHKYLTHMYLVKNYYKTSLRSMLRNPLTSFINVFGIAIANGICICV